MMMDHLLEALGATPTYYPMKVMCCGGSLMGTREEVALRLCRNLLLCAQQDKADCIAVACPLCQMNLDAYQATINRTYGTDFNLPDRLLHPAGRTRARPEIRRAGAAALHRSGNPDSRPLRPGGPL